MKAKPKRGRPKVAADKAKSGLMQTRLSDLERQSFQDAADLDGKKLAEWVRDRLRRAARQELQSADKPVPFLS